jgi:hypothetical protein
MKKLILLAAAAGMSFGANAQRVSEGHTSKMVNLYANPNKVSAKTTSIYDTLTNTVLADTPTLYYAGMTSDSGFLSGTDAYGDMGYSERYDFNSTDSNLQVIGVVTLFGGTVNPASTKNVTFYTWNVGPQVLVSTNVYESGFPNTALDSVTVPITKLGIATADTLADTFKTFLFTTPTAYLKTSFFVGYQINYDYTALAGDTIGLYTTTQYERTTPVVTLSGVDTIVNNQNATLYNDGSGWHDNATDNFDLPYEFYIYPIVSARNVLSVKGITKNNLTFFGNYPNPAVNSTDVSFSLANNTGVTLQVTDMSGRVINTIKQSNLGAGSQTININTSNMQAGDYIYLLRTTEGDGFGGKLTVVK